MLISGSEPWVRRKQSLHCPVLDTRRLQESNARLPRILSAAQDADATLSGLVPATSAPSLNTSENGYDDLHITTADEVVADLVAGRESVRASSLTAVEGATAANEAAQRELAGAQAEVEGLDAELGRLEETLTGPRRKAEMTMLGCGCFETLPRRLDRRPD